MNIETAQEAMDYIDVQRAIGLTPVMRDTKFYRHSFSASQFGSYLVYLDERGTEGRCQPRNLLRTFDFISLGQPVPGSLPAISIPPRPREPGVALIVATIPAEQSKTLLEAAEAAILVMPAGVERDDLEMAIAAERRTH